MTEFQAAVALANRVLERSNADPDDELALLSRQFLRVLEKQSVPKWFPIQRSTPIRWHLAQRAYDTYARLYGTEQTLERLAERGGFGLQEFACLFNGHKPREGHAECVEKADAVGRKIAALEKAVEDLQRDLVAQHDPTGDLIQANRDQILKMHEEAVQRICKVLIGGGNQHDAEKLVYIGKILSALRMFHPMHGESWRGWPEGSKS